MREREQPMTQTMNVSDARAKFSELLNQVYRRQKRVVVQKSGIPVAAIVSAGDLERLKRWEQEQARRLGTLARIREPFRDVPAEEIEQEVATAIAHVRAEDAKAPTRRRA